MGGQLSRPGEISEIVTYAVGRGTLSGAPGVNHETLKAKGFGAITTEIRAAPAFFYAEDYHQQYLGKNPNGYCGLGGTGVSCPAGLAVETR